MPGTSAWVIQCPPKGLILATVFLCPVGTPPAVCTIETAVDVLHGQREPCDVRAR